MTHDDFLISMKKCFLLLCVSHTVRIALSGGGRITHNSERSLDASMDGPVIRKSRTPPQKIDRFNITSSKVCTCKHI